MNSPLTSIFLLVAITAMGVIAACHPAEDLQDNAPHVDDNQVEAINYGGVYSVPLKYNPTTLDPARLNDWNGYFIANQLFEGLVQFGPHLTVLPALAHSWQVENKGLVYRFFLRDNVRFHNGLPVSGEDVEFSILRLLRMEPPPAILPHLLRIDGATEYRNRTSNRVQGLRVVTPRMVVMRLVQPYSPFLTALGTYQAAIVPKDEVRRDAAGFGRNPIGCGPFQMDVWEAGRTIRLSKYSDYYGGPAFLDHIEFRIYADGESDQILTDFKQGRLMEMSGHGYEKRAFAGMKDLTWLHRPSLGLLYYGIRRDTHPLLKYPEFRKALLLSIDKQRLTTEAYGGQFEPAWSVLPPGVPGFKPEDMPKKAGGDADARGFIEALMKKSAGNIPPLEIVSAIKSPLAEAELAFVKSCWSELGIEVEIKYIPEWEDFEKYLNSDAAHIFRCAWLAEMPDPDSILYPLFGTDAPANYSKYSNTAVDRQLYIARSILEPLERAQAYGDIEKMVMKDTPVIPIAYLSVDRVYQREVKGVNVSALGHQSAPLHRVWLERDSELRPETKP